MLDVMFSSKLGDMRHALIYDTILQAQMCVPANKVMH